MKLATLRRGGRDGTLVVVDRDLKRALPVPEIAATLQRALDDWDRLHPALEKVSRSLNAGEVAGALPFASQDVAAPLPRAYQWCDGSAYLSHAELVRKARKAEMPQSLYSDPLVYQGGSDVMLGARDDIRIADETWGIDLEAEIAVVTADVPMGTSVAAAGTYIRLVMLVNDVSLRNLIPSELAKQFGFFQSKPPTAFSPVAVTPDELGEAWDGRKLSLPLISHVNGRLLGSPNAGVDLDFDFPQLIAHVSRTRPLGAGAIVGSGTVANRDPAAGSSCLAERRMLEIIADGEPKTPFLAFGDSVRIEMLDQQGHSIFGAIEQTVKRYVPPSA
ncbi:MAG: fumarylacetoacetate hydrolase family protein [Rhodopseudomonas sp.]|uniref:fumarylacetoacetate hydrolase family protein n=1 Tax=Rhodopseudomonas sp. TaxID=1078 RepID=UPI0017C147E0|nr:fumarylacetoacetate hydrolase family protein [Rhodopseudomonas sp.]NVN88833.1 fumarylacetoacetate hydrolase family protein [Rhodopseudomonas sp.]